MALVLFYFKVPNFPTLFIWFNRGKYYEGNLFLCISLSIFFKCDYFYVFIIILSSIKLHNYLTSLGSLGLWVVTLCSAAPAAFTRGARAITRRSSVEMTCLSALHWASAGLFSQVWVSEGVFSWPGINMMRVITAILALCLSLCAGSFLSSFN